MIYWFFCLGNSKQQWVCNSSGLAWLSLNNLIHDLMFNSLSRSLSLSPFLSISSSLDWKHIRKHSSAVVVTSPSRRWIFKITCLFRCSEELLNSALEIRELFYGTAEPPPPAARGDWCGIISERDTANYVLVGNTHTHTQPFHAKSTCYLSQAEVSWF